MTNKLGCGIIYSQGKTHDIDLEATEMTMNEKKTYILGMNKAHLVKELVVNGNFEVEAAVDYVYDKITLTTEEFRMKYFGF